MNNRYLLEEQTGHPQDPGDVKWQLIKPFYFFYAAKTVAEALSQQKSYTETGLRIYDLEKEKAVWSNLQPSIVNPELRRRARLSELNELKVEAEEKDD